MKLERLEHLTREETSAPDFRSRVTSINGNYVPIRAYLHKSGTPVFLGSQNHSIDDTAKLHLLESVFGGNPELAEGKDYFIAAMWGNDSAKMIDLFGYSGIKNWPGNPDVSAYVLKNGVYVPEEREITCGDTLVILGIEEQHRRRTKDLTDYMEHPPLINGVRIS